MNKFLRNVGFYLLIILVAISVIDYFSTKNTNRQEVEYTQFLHKRGDFKRKDFKRDSKEDKKGYKPHRSKFGERPKEERKFKERKTFKRDTENRKPFRKNKATENKNFEPKAPRKILTLKK